MLWKYEGKYDTIKYELVSNSNTCIEWRFTELPDNCIGIFSKGNTNFKKASLKKIEKLFSKYDQLMYYEPFCLLRIFENILIFTEY